MVDVDAMGGGLGAVTTGGLNRGGDVGVSVGNDSDIATAGSSCDSLDVVINVSFCDKFN